MTSEQEYREEQIKAAARSVRGEEFEHAVVLTRDGDVYWRGTNRARTYVQTPPDMPGGAIVVHNHPNECGSPWCAGRCALRDDAPLSRQDVAMALHSGVSEIIAVHTNWTHRPTNVALQAP